MKQLLIHIYMIRNLACLKGITKNSAFCANILWWLMNFNNLQHILIWLRYDNSQKCWLELLSILKNW
jgi:hypothetical protein